MFLAVCLPLHAATTVTVDDNSQVNVSPQEPQAVVVVTPVVNIVDFEGTIERMDRESRMIDVIDAEGRTRQVLTTPEAFDTSRAGDFVRVHAVVGMREVTLTKEDSNRDLEGRIINVDNSKNTIVIHDAKGHDRRVVLKQGMINNYKVDDYVRIHLMADLKEAKMIQTVQ